LAASEPTMWRRHSCLPRRDSSRRTIRAQFPPPSPPEHPEGRWLFVTWHLPGSLPHALYPPPDKLSSGKAFVWMDRYLDTARHEPLYLRQEPVARIVLRSLQRGEEWGHYFLRAYVIMANHVHALLLPRVPPARLLQSLKGSTAREANRVLGRTGEILAGGVLRSLGWRGAEAGANCRLHRKQPGKGWAGDPSGGLSLVQREPADRRRRDESRRGRLRA